MKWLLTLAFSAFFMLAVSWGIGEYYVQTTHSSDASSFLTTTKMVSGRAWEFAEPLLRLLIVLVVLQWFLKHNNFTWPSNFASIPLDARLIVALMVVLTFCISALGGFMIEGLKEATLVVLGFYFGSIQRRETPNHLTGANTA